MHFAYLTTAGLSLSEFDTQLLASLVSDGVTVSQVMPTPLVATSDADVLPAAGPPGVERVVVPCPATNERRLAWFAYQVASDEGMDGIICRGRVMARALAGNETVAGRLVLCIADDEAADYLAPEAREQVAAILRASAMVVAPESLHDYLLQVGPLARCQLLSLSDGLVSADPEPWMQFADAAGVPLPVQLACAVSQGRTLTLRMDLDLGDLSPSRTGPDEQEWRVGSITVRYARSGPLTGGIHLVPDADMVLASEAFGRQVWKLLAFHRSWPLAAIYTADPAFADYLAKHSPTAPLCRLVMSGESWAAWGSAEWGSFDRVVASSTVVVVSETERADLELRAARARGRVIVARAPFSTGGPDAEQVQGSRRLIEARAKHGVSAPRINTRRDGRVLLAGHDLKFAGLLSRSLRESFGLDIVTDVWETQHVTPVEPASSNLSEADVVWVEYASGAAAWYSKNVAPHQRLVIRVHGYELLGAWAEDVDFDRVDCLVFVSEMARRAGLEKWTVNPAKTRVIPNAVDTEQLLRPKRSGAAHTLGLLGWRPSLKRLDRAVSLLERLLAQDARYKLIVKGESPTAASWMWNDPAERRRYEAVFAKLRERPDLSSRVAFEDAGTDVPDWLRDVGWILSPSDRESFHLAAVEGMASGAVPLVWKRPGAEEVFPEPFVVSDTAAAAEVLLNNSGTLEFSARSQEAVDGVASYELSRVARLWARVLAHD